MQLQLYGNLKNGWPEISCVCPWDIRFILLIIESADVMLFELAISYCGFVFAQVKALQKIVWLDSFHITNDTFIWCIFIIFFLFYSTYLAVALIIQLMGVFWEITVSFLIIYLIQCKFLNYNLVFTPLCLLKLKHLANESHSKLINIRK